MFLNYRLLSILFWGLFFFNDVSAQRGKIAPDQLQAVTIQDDTSIVRARVLLEEVEIDHRIFLHYRTYYRDRMLITQGSHLGRLLHGRFQRFDNDMVLLEEGVFDRGLPVEEWKRWRDGQLYEVTNYKNGRRHGSFERYDTGGHLALKATYRKGELNGKHETYEQGELTATEKYRAGELLPEKIKKSRKDSTAIAEEGRVATMPSPSSSTKSTVTPDPPDRNRPANRTRTRRTVRKKTSPPPKPETAPESENNDVTSNGDRNIQIFVTDRDSRQGLKQVSIKISQFQRTVEDAKFKFFGYTDEDGHYQLPAEENAYVLFITHKGYRPYQLRVNTAQAQDSYLVELEPTPSCGNLSGTVQPAAKNTAVSGAAVHLKDQRGRLLKTTYSDSQGNFEVCLPCNERYDIIVESDDYQRLQERVFLPANCIDLPQTVVLYLPGNRPRPSEPAPLQRPDTRIAVTGEDAITETPAAVPSRRRARPTTSPYRTVGNDAAFFVIAGTFSRRSNAESRLTEVRAAGFSDAQIVQLSDSGFFAVSLGNLDSRDAAAALLNRFESQTRINAYVRDHPF